MELDRRACAGQPNARRRRAQLCSAVALSALCASGVHAQDAVRSAPAVRDGGDPRPLIVTPHVGVQEGFTDNARLTEDNRDSDFVTRVFAGIDATLNGARTKGALRARAAYDFYADADDLNGWSTNGFGFGSYDLVQDVLSLEADAGITYGYVSSYGGSAFDRSGVDNRVHVTTAGFGPRLRTTLPAFDLNASARVAHVAYGDADGSSTGPLPTDTTQYYADASLDTMRRLTNVQLNLSVAYEEDDQDFESLGAVASGYFNVAPTVRLIARAGYDNIQAPFSVDISDPYWALGAEYRPTERTQFSVEGGQRYGEATWAAQADIAVTNRFYLSASYDERVEPDQSRVYRDFQSFVVQQGTVATPLTPDQFAINGNLYGSTALNKQARVAAAYTWDVQQLDVSATWADRYFYSTRASDKSISADVNYTRQLRPDLALGLGGDYWETYDSPVYGENRSYSLRALLTYSLNPTLRLTGGYGYRKNEDLRVGGADVYENAVFASLVKTF